MPTNAPPLAATTPGAPPAPATTAADAPLVPATAAGTAPAAMTADAPSSWQLALSGMALIGVCYGLARFAYGLFVPDLRAAFGLDAAMVGAIGAGSYAGYVLAIVASVLATGRLGARSVALAAGVVATVGTATVAAAPHPGVLAAGILLAGMSTGIASPPLAAAVARWVVVEQRDRIQTVVNAGTGLGVLVSGPVALAVTGQWRLGWASFAVLAAVATAWVARTVPAGRGEPTTTRATTGSASPGLATNASPTAPGPTRPGAAHSARDVGGLGSGRRRDAVTMVLAALGMGLTSAAVWVFGRDVVVTVGGLSPASTTWLWVLLGVAGLAGALAGDLVGRLGLGRAWSVAMVALAIATAALGMLPGVGPVAFAAAAMFGGSYIALTGVLLVWGTRVYPERPAVGVGLAFLMIAVGQTVGAFVVGWLSSAASLSAAFTVLAGLAAGGAALRPHRDPPTPARPPT